MSTAPFCSPQILNLATQIYNDINAPSDQSVGYISGWLTNSGAMLAELNNRLGTCYWMSGDSPCIVDFGPQEGAIANQIYQSNYYKRQTLAVLQGGVDCTPWTQIAEGDSRVTRESRTSFAKEYRGLYKESEEKLDTLIHMWTLNHTIPAGIDAAQTYQYPSP